MIQKVKWGTLSIVFMMMSCQSNKKSDTAQEVRTSFFDVSGMDTTVHPGDNFFEYANGAWMKNTQIPASETGWGSFYILENENLEKLRSVLENAAKSADKKGSDQQKAGDFYASGMDTVTIDKLGAKPIEGAIQKINALKSIEELIAYAADGFKEGDGDLFTFYVAADDRISTKNALQFFQGGLNLPEASYYLDQDDKAKKIRKAYVAYLVKLFGLIGEGANAQRLAE